MTLASVNHSFGVCLKTVLAAKKRKWISQTGCDIWHRQTPTDQNINLRNKYVWTLEWDMCCLTHRDSWGNVGSRRGRETWEPQRWLLQPYPWREAADPGRGVAWRPVSSLPWCALIPSTVPASSPAIQVITVSLYLSRCCSCQQLTSRIVSNDNDDIDSI